jgi:hypothetical protein
MKMSVFYNKWIQIHHKLIQSYELNWEIDMLGFISDGRYEVGPAVIVTSND